MTTTTDSLVREQAAGAARGRWLMLIVLLAGQFMALLDVTVVNVIGVATFGSLFLTLDSARGPVVSGHALAVTFGWLAAAMALGAAAGIPLARTVAAARAPAA